MNRVKLKIFRYLLCSLVDVQYNVAIWKYEKRKLRAKRKRFPRCIAHRQEGIKDTWEYLTWRCFKTAQAIELSRLFFDCIIKTVKDDYSILLYQNGTFEFQRKIVNVISRPTPTHFLTFFFINGKYVKQHSFSVLVNFYEFKKLFLFKSYSNSSLNKCMVVFNHFWYIW